MKNRIKLLEKRTLIPENMCLIVKYGLSNASPKTQYSGFSVTADIYRNKTFNTSDKYFHSGGCLHEEVLTYFPELADIVSYHLRDIDGKPLYPVENGLFYAEQVERFEFDKKSQDYWLSALSEHLDISPEETAAFLKKLLACQTKSERENFFSAKVLDLAPMWAAKAAAIIEKYNL